MTYFDPQYGYLMTSKEVAEITGFTLNQLRNFRQRGNSPIHFLSDGNTSWYRKEDVIRYVENHGTKKLEYHKTGDYEAAPITGSPADIYKREDIAAMSKIVTSNAWSKWTEKLTQNGPLSVSDGMKFLRAETVRLLKLGTGDDLEELYPGETYDFWLRTNDPVRFWKGRTWATRSLARQIYEWNVTDEDIINVPIGEVPPSKIE